MVNIISSELYKITKSKIFYGIILFLLLLNIVLCSSSSYIKNMSSSSTTLSVTGIAGYQSSFQTDIVFYIILIFTASLITSEYSNSTIRQITCHGIPRWKLVLGQYIAMSSVITVALVTFGILNMVFNTVLCKFGQG